MDDLWQALEKSDPEIFRLIAAEERRERDAIRLIPSENYVSAAVLAATGSVLTNKYSEGYAGRRYYEGQKYIDQIETTAIERAKTLVVADHANVQPYPGSPCNLAVYLAFVKPGDTVMGMSLPHGGHLTHGWGVSITGKYFRAVQYEVDRATGRVDFDRVRELALKERPKLLWAGGTAIPRQIDFAKFGEIAREVGALFVADIAHIAGLVAGGAHPSPVPMADAVTTTTHKTLRGPRGGMFVCKAEHQKALDRAVFPGLQGGPHNHTTAGIAVALREAAQPAFKDYAHEIVANAKALAEALLARGYDLVSGGTDNHLILIDLTNKELPGKVAAKALDHAGIELNYNTVPFDPRKPFDPSGIRLGTPALVRGRAGRRARMARLPVGDPPARRAGAPRRRRPGAVAATGGGGARGVLRPRPRGPGASALHAAAPRPRGVAGDAAGGGRRPARGRACPTCARGTPPPRAAARQEDPEAAAAEAPPPAHRGQAAALRGGVLRGALSAEAHAAPPRAAARAAGHPRAPAGRGDHRAPAGLPRRPGTGARVRHGPRLAGGGPAPDAAQAPHGVAGVQAPAPAGLTRGPRSPRRSVQRARPRQRTPQ